MSCTVCGGTGGPEPQVQLAAALDVTGGARSTRPATTCCSSPTCSACGSRGTATGARRSKAGIQIPVNDPSVLASALAAATEHLGIVFTSSIMQDHPFNFARRMSSLDHYTDGRLGWNIVTSFNTTCSAASATTGTLAHDERYEWADEYVDVAYKLWEGSLGRGCARAGQGARHATPTRRRSTRSTMSASATASRARILVAVAAAHPGAVPGRFVTGGPAVLRRATPRASTSAARTPPPLRADHGNPRAGGRQRPRLHRTSRSLRGCRSSSATRHADAVRRNDELKRYLDLEGIALHALGDAGIDARQPAAGDPDQRARRFPRCPDSSAGPPSPATRATIRGHGLVARRRRRRRS